MAYERKDGDLVLFQNNKRANENQPTMRGDLLWGGKLLEVACWTKLDRNGDKFLTGKIKVKEARAPKGAVKSKLTEADVTDSEIPF